MSTEDSPEEKPAAKGERRRGDIFGISALASALLSGLAGEKLAQSLDSGGWVGVVGISLTIGFALIWAIYNAPVGLRRYRRWRAGAAGIETSGEVHAVAEEAEQWLVSLGSSSGGLAATAWFELNELRLRNLLANEKPDADSADDLARICDALEAWYITRHEPAELLDLSDYLTAVADGSGRRDLLELAAARAATAYRMLGDLETASTKLGISDNVAPARRGHSRTAAALETRRQVERALLHLARADAAPAGNDREEAALNARDRLDDARLSRPGPDVAGDVAIAINLAIVHLYQQDPEGALDQLRPAAARATTAGDTSGQAHAFELTGVAAWMLERPDEAKKWWQHAEHLYAEIDEREGQGRCLQHLGSAAVVAGEREKARELLQQSALLRSFESPTLVTYLEAATETGTPPEVPPEPRRATVGRIRRLIDRWLLR
ncbi:hypothetical protein Kfla_6422 [Kribbella flavida DSM 17836]|uniref:Tetratricopeptide repeat protein n=1 Tax=Kribbella flavida (strain DSM 17836 / JCM 10339 / NBRC 14399) TaxID=479435 RepID=D2PX39_KRIFD|nr:hypothetical protein [Kribbella flavida]ADB35419.1 hypothetical protein Kfla_6422 [Kribbella flavida DSM 17836]